MVSMDYETGAASQRPAIREVFFGCALLFSTTLAGWIVFPDALYQHVGATLSRNVAVAALGATFFYAVQLWRFVGMRKSLGGDLGVATHATWGVRRGGWVLLAALLVMAACCVACFGYLRPSSTRVAEVCFDGLYFACLFASWEALGGLQRIKREAQAMSAPATQGGETGGAP